MRVYFRHHQFEYELLYCLKRWANTKKALVKEGDPSQPMDLLVGEVETASGSDPAPEVETEEDEDHRRPIPVEAFALTGTSEDITRMLGIGLDVDDDNGPAPENIPTPGTQDESTPELFWGWNGVDYRDQ